MTICAVIHYSDGAQAFFKSYESAKLYLKSCVEQGLGEDVDYYISTGTLRD